MKKKTTKKTPAKPAKKAAKKAPVKKEAPTKKSKKAAKVEATAPVKKDKKAKAGAPAKATSKKKAPAKSGAKSRYGHGEGTQAAMMDDLLWEGTTTKAAIKAIGVWQKKNKGSKSTESSRSSAWQTHIKKLKDAGLNIVKKGEVIKAKSAKFKK